MQVGIVNEGMRFPLWLHGHTIVEFLVVSISPKKSVGKRNLFGHSRTYLHNIEHACLSTLFTYLIFLYQEIYC